MSEFVVPIVVLDTTALRADLGLQGAHMRRVMEWSRLARVSLHLPEVVIREYKRHYRREGSHAVRELVSGLGKLSKLQVDTAFPSGAQVRDEVDGLVSRRGDALVALLTEHANILPLPQMDHEALLDRALADAKPFSASGAGYRDALIWGSILDLCGTLSGSSTVVFVTANHRDFCDGDTDTLAPDLLLELQERCLEPPAVVRVPTLAAALEFVGALTANDDAVLSEAEESDDTRLDLPDQEDLANVLRRSVLAACDKLIGQEIADPNLDHHYFYGLPFDDLELPEGFTDASISALEADERTLDFSAYDTYESGTTLYKASIYADIEVNGFMDKSAYYVIEDRVEDRVDLLDADWNEWTVWVGVSRNVFLSFDVTAYPDLAEVEEVSLESASGFWPTW